MNTFYFYIESRTLKLNNEDKIIHIPSNITTENSLFLLYEKELQTPPEFGKNWNAFYDNLGSLWFVKNENIIIIHDDIPFANNEENQRIYIEILFDSIEHWHAFPEHKLHVYFPVNCQNEIIKILKTRDYK